MIPSWDKYFLQLTDAIAVRSKDPNTKIGCVIVGPNHEIRSTGYNSFPRGIVDNVPERLERPEKYLWIEHAERNAIYNAARCGTALDGCTIYISVLPCVNCARAIVQCGIKRVVVQKERNEAYTRNPQWTEEFERTKQLFWEAGVALDAVEMEIQ